MTTKMDDRARLIGAINPVAGPAGFLIPVFQRTSTGDTLLTQEIGSDGRIYGFEQIRQSRGHVMAAKDKTNVDVGVGDAALWSFHFGGDDLVIQTRDLVRSVLRKRLAELRPRPFTYLQAALFCDSDPEIVQEALRDAYHYLKIISPPSAEMWRDLTILLPALRRSIGDLVRDLGLQEISKNDIDEVQVHVVASKVVLQLPNTLYNLLSRNPHTGKFLEQAASHGRAFGIQVAELIPQHREGIPATPAGAASAEPATPRRSIVPASSAGASPYRIRGKIGPTRRGISRKKRPIVRAGFASTLSHAGLQSRAIVSAGFASTLSHAGLQSFANESRRDFTIGHHGEGLQSPEHELTTAQRFSLSYQENFLNPMPATGKLKAEYPEPSSSSTASRLVDRVGITEIKFFPSGPKITLNEDPSEQGDDTDHDTLTWMVDDLQLRGPSRPVLSKKIVNDSRSNLRPEKPPAQLLGYQRKKELEEAYRRLLNEEFPILVYGAPGIGKSAFLATLINKPEVQKTYGNEILWIDLRSGEVSKASQIADLVARALNFSEVLEGQLSEEMKLKRLQTALVRALPKHIFVFDNVDVREQEKELLRIYEGVTIRFVIGSRSRFEDIDAEQFLLKELDRQAAVDMFRHYANIDVANPGIAPICELIGYHPLAIKLMASAIGSGKIRPERLFDDLRSQDIGGIVAWSYNELPYPQEKYIFDAFGAFASSGVPLSAIARVTRIPLGTLYDRRLPRLQSRALVQQNEKNPSYYKLHPLLYEFAQQRLNERESSMMSAGASFDDTPTGQMILFFVEYTKDHAESFRELEAARDNVMHAAELAWENNISEAVYSLWESTELWFEVTGDWSNMFRLLERAIKATRSLKDREIELAKALHFRSIFSELTGKLPDLAIADAKESLALGYKVRDPKTTINGLVRVGQLYQEYGHFEKNERAHAYFDNAWTICQDFLDWDESAYVAYQLGCSYWYSGNTRAARELFEKSIDISECFPKRRISRRYKAYCVTALGNLLVDQEEFEKAREYLKKSLKLKKGDQYSRAFSISSLARLELQLGNFEKAVELLDNARATYDKYGAASNSFRTLRQMGEIFYQQGKYTEAVAAYENAKKAGLRTELSRELASTLSELGTIYHELDRYNEALEAFREGLKILTELPERTPFVSDELPPG